jgi:hypothetical protein
LAFQHIGDPILPLARALVEKRSAARVHRPFRMAVGIELVIAQPSVEACLEADRAPVDRSR